jgi:beta-barrel assembly-enhancing protease
MTRLNRLALTIFAAAASTYVLGGEIRLPDFGDSAAAMVTPQEEEEYANGFLAYLRANDLILEDPEITEHVQTIGRKLLEASERPELNVHFVVLKEPHINAFATPGGVIAIHTGLILSASSDNEIAAVLSHELAHVSQRHIARFIERQSKAQLPLMLATLGAAIVASRSGTGDAAGGVILSGMALGQQLGINFTRDNEYEADRVGIQTLHKANFDTAAMAGFFSRLQRASRSDDNKDVPALLRDHPVTTTRIAEAKTRAAQFNSKVIPGEAERFSFFRERVRVLQDESSTGLLKFYQNALLDSANPSWRYGEALAKVRSGDPQSALLLLEQIQATPSTAESLELAKAEAEAGLKRVDAFRQRFDRMLTARPNNEVISKQYAAAMLRQRSPELARKAAELLRPLADKAGDDPTLFELYAQCLVGGGDKVRGAENFARAAMLRGQIEDALQQLQEVAKRHDLDFYQRARVDAQVADLMPAVLELRKRENRDGPERRNVTLR